MNANDTKSSSNDYLPGLRDQITSHFNKDELADLCFELGLDYDRLSGDNTGAKTRELVMHFYRRNRLGELVEKCQKSRPNLDWSAYKTTPSESPSGDSHQRPDLDRDLFEFFRMIFNRPAFRGPMMWQTDPKPFKSAIDLTLQAVNTGVVQNRHGIVLRKYEGMTWPADKNLRSKMEEIQSRLHTVSMLIEKLIGGDADRGEILKAIDNERDEIIKVLNGMLARFDIPLLPIPTEVKDSTNVWEQFPRQENSI